MDRAPAPALTAASLALVLVVIAASLVIRLSGQDLEAYLPLVRGVHRVSASAATLMILAVGWLAWRADRRAAAAAIVALTAALSVLGAATGTSPPPLAQAGNLLGGLALAAMLAWLLGPGAGISRTILVVIGLGTGQALLGAWISIFAEELWSAALIAHATLGLGLAGAAAWLALRARAYALLGLALAAPVAGLASALLGQPLAASLAHAMAAALLIAAAAHAHRRLT